jgi:hypothetical protein
MGRFGRGDDNDGKGEGTAALHATRDRLAALPLAELADEILWQTFGPGTGNEWQRLPIADVYKRFDPTGSGNFPGLPQPLVLEVQYLIEEGLQQLEHGALIVQGVLGSNYSSAAFHLTRAGATRLGL